MQNKTKNGRSHQQRKKKIKKESNHQNLRKKKGFYMNVIQKIIAKKEWMTEN